MGLDFVDLFFNLNLPGFHSFKYGDDFIEFFVGSHNSFSTWLYSGSECMVFCAVSGFLHRIDIRYS